jgi:hypothetical protein
VGDPFPEMVQRDYYGVETKVLNQAVKRNFNRFPKDFMLKLIKEEIEALRSHFSTLNKQRGYT